MPAVFCSWFLKIAFFFIEMVPYLVQIFVNNLDTGTKNLSYELAYSEIAYGVARTWVLPEIVANTYTFSWSSSVRSTA